MIVQPFKAEQPAVQVFPYAHCPVTKQLNFSLLFIVGLTLFPSPCKISRTQMALGMKSGPSSAPVNAIETQTS